MDSSVAAPTAAQRIALERAEALFERRGVAEIREIEKATLKQIDEKKHKLRELVGESYNDVIKSADAFVSMSSRCQTIVKNVVQIQRGFTAGEIGVSGLAGGSSLESLASGKSPLDELHAVGSRVKYLVDTPELIWSSLDSGDFLEASRRWLRAKLVHDTLQQQCAKALLLKFPLLQHLWPNVEKLKAQVTDQILQHLCKAHPLPPSKAAPCLAALASLSSSSDSNQVLKDFFDSREACILEHLRAGHTENFLADLTTTIQDAIVQVGDLFLIPKQGALNMGGGNPPSSRLEQVISQDDVGYSGLLFGSLGDWDGSEGIAEEVEWGNQLNKLKESLSPIAPDAGAKHCRAWLTSVAEKLLESGMLLLGSCNSLHELSLVEGTVKSLVTGWKAVPESGAKSSGSDAERDVLTWAETVEASMDLKLDVWEDVFEKPFRKRALELVESAFHELERDLQTELTSNLAEISESVPEPLGAARMTQWCDSVDLDLAGKLANPEVLLASPRRALVNSRSKRSDGSARLDAKSRAKLLAKVLDDRLADTLDGVVELLDWSEDSKLSSRNDGGPPLAFTPSRSGSHRFRAVEKSARRSDLEPRIRAVCERAALALADGLGSRLDSLANTEDEPSAVESALFVGTLCLEVAGTSQTLPIFVGPPENWRSRTSGEDGSPVRTARTPSTALFTPRSARSKPESTSENIQALRSQFRMVGLKGFQIWANWAANGLAQGLSRAVEEDYVFGLVEAPGSWERVVISNGSGAGEGSNDEMHFLLPSSPSGTMMMAMLAACRELGRVGDHSVSTEVLQLFEWELGSLVCGALERLLAPGGALSERLHEVGVLQLLLDVRFLRDALLGAQPVSSLTGKPSTPAPSRADLSRRSSGGFRQFAKDGNAGVNSAALAGRKKLFASLESTLSNRLDPIDWATYEPHLWKIEERFYQRTSVLFGALTQLNPVHSGVSIKLPSTAETNMMNLIPVVPRFQYLPIRAPTSTQRKGPGLATTQAALESMVSSSSMIDPTGNFSFSNLGSQRGASGTDAEQSASASSTFATLQEKLGTGSLGSLGTMIGDKAVSALAQQFGDLTSGSSWLSTLSFKGMGRTSGTGSSRS